MNPPIYMDHHATTPVDARVLDAMLPYLKEHFGNAASRNHAFGWKAEEAEQPGILSNVVDGELITRRRPWFHP